MDKYHRYTPRPEDVSEKLMEGVWIDHHNQLHVCAVTICENMGWPVTDENLARIDESLIELAKDKFRPDMPVIKDYSPSPGS